MPRLPQNRATAYLEYHQETRRRYASEVKRNATLTWPLRNQYHSLGEELSLKLPSLEAHCSRARINPNRNPRKKKPKRGIISEALSRSKRSLAKDEVVSPFEADGFGQFKKDLFTRIYQAILVIFDILSPIKGLISKD